MRYSKQQLNQLISSKPHDIQVIVNDLIKDVPSLILLIETIGESTINQEDIYPILNRLLKHIHAHVRESAILAFMEFYDGKIIPEEIFEKIQYIHDNDPSSIVRDCAKDLLLYRKQNTNESNKCI